MKLYPLTFTPIIKERIWGGSKLNTFLNKEVSIENAGESWELSSVPNDVSVVNNGELSGKNLNEIIAINPEALLGKEVVEKFGTEFPLLFKFLDANKDLSVQLHPNDELAKARHNSFGKTEMWYVMQADKGSRIIVGFKENSSQEEYLSHLANKSVVSLLNEIPVKIGDVFLLETGAIHAIGSGVVIAEIQQTSDITYRIYDWDRVDAEGKSRELHTELALEAINYKVVDTKINYSLKENERNTCVNNTYFTTNIISLVSHFKWKRKKSSFTVLMCTEDDFSIHLDNDVYRYKKGDTVLIPAEIDAFELQGKATILEISI
ncbi:type I phosphomannose isomerase catalytic subunit [Flavobacterium sp.]|jgi:mannose-6-phosphate isomerase|uniref:type I phosphomannose isomerase catalytic subunit n=1 Tax=Flavobacterium sp. TaxID=239 RepID=UPI002A82C24A|nr:type I phosphomannose isomerase catalytic subunit [Flavobacterium sp.]